MTIIVVGVFILAGILGVVLGTSLRKSRYKEYSAPAKVTTWVVVVVIMLVFSTLGALVMNPGVFK